jgi:hypothetical protein
VQERRVERVAVTVIGIRSCFGSPTPSIASNPAHAGGVGLVLGTLEGSTYGFRWAVAGRVLLAIGFPFTGGSGRRAVKGSPTSLMAERKQPPLREVSEVRAVVGRYAIRPSLAGAGVDVETAAHAPPQSDFHCSGPPFG